MDAHVVIASIDDVGTDTIALELETPDGFSAEPGQFIKLTGTVDDEEYSRFYTLSSPDTDETFETTIEIDHEEGGPFSAYLAALEPGDEIEMSGPYGSDHYEGEPRVVVIAGGPGIGPAVGIGERALADGNEAAIVYRDEALAHRARLETLADRGATVQLLEDETADLADAVDDVVTDDPEEQVFVYGFASFIEDVEDALEAIGSSTDGAKIENFG
ncbi:FAD-dependent oxidoreductase [Halopenitus sp. POP-27]|uniref:FAD-dependent oxidoreductase n=1 Tax=Halopenitus sp. POP-27 TaxID=2994425 RepID=UPI0024689F3E|nr:FAD-dependent oxidoreductase [Halopenitus sp. POP-27]